VKRVNGTQTCATSTPDQETSGGNPNFTLRDPDNDGNWDWVQSSTTYHSFDDAFFDAGNITTNGERHASSDNGHQDFNGLQLQNDTGWHDWTSPSTYSSASDDPGFCNQIDSNTEVEVVGC
jgi:hypothetical protein